MKRTYRRFFQPWLQKGQRLQQSGFTLLELLVAILIGGLLTSGLLFIVIELLQVNQREERLTQTQQDVRRAIDYITSDLSEAVFVYASPDTVVDQLTDLPAGAAPVLAFWRLDPIDVNQAPANCAALAEAKKRECEALKIRQNIYTLVVYLQQDNANNGIWEGPARVIRYELSKYDDIKTLAQNTGYADPTVEINEAPNSFADWTNGDVATDGNAQVLTDHIHINDNAKACPDPATYTRTPADSDSFYACVRTGTQSQNKSVIVYLQGNASKAADDPIVGLSEASGLPKLESEVLIRGVIEKLPPSDS